MKGNKLIDDHKQISVNLARLRTHGKVYEIAIDPDLAIKYKNKEKVNGNFIDLDEIIQSERVFADMKKGIEPTEDELLTSFNTANMMEVARQILEKGELQFTSKYRDELRERKRQKVIELIHRNAIDPKTNLPHPKTRIEAALEEVNIKVDDMKKAEDQIGDIINKLRPVLPIKFDVKILEVSLQHQYNKVAKGILSKYGKVEKEFYDSQGGANIRIRLPAGLQQEFIDELNKITHGSSNVRIVEE